MDQSPLKSLAEYSQFISKFSSRLSVKQSTVVVFSDSPYTGTAKGEILFQGDLRLRIRELIDFDEGLIESYSYELYWKGCKLYWYDDMPHPTERLLAQTLPHHKHIPPDIKHHRIPAPKIKFNRPNLPVLVEEVEELIGNPYLLEQLKLYAV